MSNDAIKVTELQNEAGYFSRNSKWLDDFVYLLGVTLFFFSFEYLRSYLISDPPGLEGIRLGHAPWLFLALYGLGLSQSVYNAYQAGTVSGKIYIWVIMLLACAGFWFAVTGAIYSLFQ